MNYGHINRLGMNKISSLLSLGIEWKGSPRLWNTLPRKLIPICDASAKVRDTSGNILYKLIPKGSLGKGTFGIVDAFEKVFPDGSSEIVALKRPTDKKLDLLLEALFQWQLHNEMKQYGLEFCIPEVYDIITYKVTNDIWFTMEAFHPYLLSQWCIKNLSNNPKYLFALLLLQISIVLEVFENKLKIDHRDLKVNNMLVVDETVNIIFKWEEKEHTLTFPFRIVFVDFGFACIEKLLDLREGDGLPPIDPCPKVGRDIFQVLASVWSVGVLRGFLEAFWGGWIREHLRCKERSYVSFAEKSSNLDWMYAVTDIETFSAPQCAPTNIIQECLRILEETL
jgi:serine/threonine protein kinase